MSEHTLLSIKGLQAWYGESHVLHGVNLDVPAGEVVCLLGRNGAGKTTTLKSIMGIVGRRSGSICFKSEELMGSSSDKVARAGIAYCPEERGIFSSLDVKENLLLPPRVATGVSHSRPPGAQSGRCVRPSSNLSCPPKLSKDASTLASRSRTAACPSVRRSTLSSRRWTTVFSGTPEGSPMERRMERLLAK